MKTMTILMIKRMILEKRGRDDYHLFLQPLFSLRQFACLQISINADINDDDEEDLACIHLHKLS